MEYKSLHDSMRCELITADNIKDEREKGLIGQYTVKIFGAHKKGDLLGFYGGVRVPRWLSSQYLPFALSANAAIDFIDGDNIVSRINTIFEYD